MKIKSLKLINFKSFVEEQTFEFEDTNLISGKNGVGKSTIKDAIIFCLYNRTVSGSLADSTRYISTGKQKCLVEVVFENNGQEHTVRRERTQKQTRITYRDASQSEEDSQITQETLESLIPKYKDFAAVFNIGWFMSLTDREKRDYILELTQPVNRSHLFDKMGGTPEDLSTYSILFNDLEKTHKQLLARKLENEKDIERMKISNEQSKSIEIPELTAKDKTAELTELKKANEKAVEIDYQWKEYERVKEQNKQVLIKNKDIEVRIAKLKILDLKMPEPDYNSLITKKHEYEKQIELPKTTCPTCLQFITPEHRNNVEKTNLKNKVELDKINAELAKKITEYNSAMVKWKENEELKKMKLLMEGQYADPLPEPEMPPNKIARTDFTELEKEQEEFVKQSERIETLKEQELARLNSIESNKEVIVVLNKENDRLRFLIEIFSPRGIPAEEMKIKLDPLQVKFKSFIPTAEITTIEMLKNEMGYKEVFHISVDGNDYAKLSLGEKTRVDISLSQIINSMLKEKIDMFFLDNSEVLDSWVSVPAQAFICKVTNQLLKIN
jgi:DNA repair exonuclease SbcCD ATPase subunit